MSHSDTGPSDEALAELDIFLQDWSNRHGLSSRDLGAWLVTKAIRCECDASGEDGPEVMRRIADQLMRRRAFELGAN
jgi:hypothetical protein